MVDEVAAAAAVGIGHGACHRILSDDLNVSHVTQHSVPRVLMQDHHGDHMSISCDLISSVDKDGMFLSYITRGYVTWCFLYDLQVRDSCHLKITIIAKKEETMAGQLQRQGNA
jgi:hypothetical protein